MKMTLIAMISALVMTNSVEAQNASTGVTTTSGYSAVSPTGNSINAAPINRPSQGSGINSGALNNGTTGDTIGTGPGTSSGPFAAPGIDPATAAAPRIITLRRLR
jgi:hypothetical protein